MRQARMSISVHRSRSDGLQVNLRFCDYLAAYRVSRLHRLRRVETRPCLLLAKPGLFVSGNTPSGLPAVDVDRLRRNAGPSAARAGLIGRQLLTKPRRFHFNLLARSKAVTTFKFVRHDASPRIGRNWPSGSQAVWHSAATHQLFAGLIPSPPERRTGPRSRRGAAGKVETSAHSLFQLGVASLFCEGASKSRMSPAD
jgi:hypothetical protein